MTDAGFVIASYVITAVAIAGYAARIIVRTRRAEATEGDR